MARKTVLLTGATGFVGRYLSERLVNEGYDVHAFVRYVSSRDVSLPGVTQHYGDLTDVLQVRDVLSEAEPDVIVHLATQSSVEYSFNHPYESYEVGFTGTVNLAQQALRTLPDLDRFVFSSSVEVYGNRDVSPLDETLAPKPASPYGVAKASAEQYLDYLHRARDFPAILFRSTNTYGRKNNHRFVVERTAWEMLDSQEVVRMGNPDPVRDFLHIEDEVDAYVAVVEADHRDGFGEIFNTGTGRGTSIRELVEMMRERTGYAGDVEWQANSHRPLEIDSLVIDATKIEEYFDWTPTISLEEGLDETVRWWESRIDSRESKVRADD